jgi:hypothetical protein
MDLSTGTMAGMPEMDSLPGGGGMLGGLMGGMGGGAQGRGAGSGNTAYGNARAMSIMPPPPGRLSISGMPAMVPVERSIHS